MDSSSTANGILTLDSTSNEKLMDIDYTIPIQTMYIRGFRCEFDTAAHALATRLVYIDFPFLSPNHVIDGNKGQTKIPLMLDNSAVTLRSGMFLPIYLNNEVPPKFLMRVLDSTFAPVANLVSFTIQFELDLASVKM